MTASTNDPLTVGDPAPDAVLRNHEDQELKLSSLWHERPLVLLFVRHFG